MNDIALLPVLKLDQYKPIMRGKSLVLVTSISVNKTIIKNVRNC